MNNVNSSGPSQEPTNWERQLRNCRTRIKSNQEPMNNVKSSAPFTGTDELGAPTQDNTMTATFSFVGRRWIVTLLLMMDILNGTRYYRRQCDDSDVRLCGST